MRQAPSLLCNIDERYVIAQHRKRGLSNQLFEDFIPHKGGINPLYDYST